MTGEINPSEVLDLRGLAEYAEGSIVSRTLVDKKAGTLTIFAFDKGQGLSEHSACLARCYQVQDAADDDTIGLD